MIEGFYMSNWPMGWLYGYRVGEILGPLHPCPNPEQRLKEFADMAGEQPEKLDGLTLFYNWTKKHWQLSTREKGEQGWIVRHIDDEQAFSILSGLEKLGHPIMAPKPKGLLQLGPVERSREEIEAEIAAQRAERTIAKLPLLAAPYEGGLGYGGKSFLEKMAAAEKVRNDLTKLIEALTI